MKLTTVVLDLMHRMVAMATFPFQMAIHPINTITNVLQTLKPTESNLQGSTSQHEKISGTIETEKDSRTTVTVKKRFSISDAGYTLLINGYDLVTKPIKSFLYNNGVVKDSEADPNNFNILAFIMNSIHQLIIFILPPIAHKPSHMSSIPCNHTNNSSDSDQADTVNNDIDFENQYNHKTEYLTKLDQENPEIVSETIPESHSIYENEVTQNESIREQDSTTEIDNPNKNINSNVKVCSVCGFESQNSSTTDTNIRNNFEHQRVEYKSQIDLLLKKIRDVEENEDLKSSDICATDVNESLGQNHNNSAESGNSL